MKFVSILSTLLLGVFASAAPDPPCGPIGPVIIRALGCLKDIFPHGHPLYAPIIGGASADFAKDMCESEKWTKGFECLVELAESCTSSTYLKDYLSGIFNKNTFESGMRNFCDKRSTYNKYVECYFDQRDSLDDCVMKNWRPTVEWFINNWGGPVNKVVKKTCSLFWNFEMCQIDEIRRTCGHKAADFLRDVTAKFKPPTCGAGSKSASLTVLSLTLTIVKLLF